MSERAAIVTDLCLTLGAHIGRPHRPQVPLNARSLFLKFAKGPAAMFLRRSALVVTRLPMAMRSFYFAAAAPKISPVDAAIADTFASFAKVHPMLFEGSPSEQPSSKGRGGVFFFSVVTPTCSCRCS